ncbi:hypothetical protein RJ640_002422 [Escallonia rubra]|uniref:Reverse transcriptase Ty1/copia-type domain-containing protein n=1 Tax=Escallonia rubra TaxID=112253 RepID=A0AA88RXK9_9ASTE|nr:hypothetical protein RJ640_002422 [Escallonia rubra]
MASLEQNKTWDLVKLPIGKSVLYSKWVYKIKNEAGGTKRYKARLVVKGYRQRKGKREAPYGREAVASGSTGAVVRSSVAGRRSPVAVALVLDEDVAEAMVVVMQWHRRRVGGWWQQQQSMSKRLKTGAWASGSDSGGVKGVAAESEQQ